MFLRSLVIAYYHVSFISWISITLPMTIITLFSYHLLTVSTLSMYLLLLITIRFLIVRTFATSERIMKKFTRMKVRTVIKKNSFGVLKQINEIVVQFKESNSIFNLLLSMIYFSVLFGSFSFPIFCFLDFTVYFKVFIMFMYSTSLVFVCFSIAIYNLSFISKVCYFNLIGFYHFNFSYQLKIKVLESTIHQVMPSFNNPFLKISFNNYLTLNNRHRHLSFTYLNSFDYSTNSLIEVKILTNLII